MWFYMIINVSLDEANKMQKTIERQKKKITKLELKLAEKEKILDGISFSF